MQTAGALCRFDEDISQGALLGPSKSVIVASAPRTRLRNRLKKCSCHIVCPSRQPMAAQFKKGEDVQTRSKGRTPVQLSLADSEFFKELLIIIWNIDRAFYIHWLNWCMFGSVSGGLPMNMPMTRCAHFFNKIGFSFFAMYVHMFWHLVIGDLHTA